MLPDTKETIKVNMLGQFSVCCGDIVFNDMVGRTKQVWTLLEYLILNRKREISQEELINVLWEDGNSDNPANALKNLVYRLRTMLSQSDLPPFNYILYKRGTYCWNEELPCVVDVELLEEYAKKAAQPEITEDEKLSFYSQAIQLYKGKFLPKSVYEQWVITLSSYYHQLYLNCVLGLCPLLNARQQYEESIQICQKAVSIDEYEESLFELLISSLIQAGNHKEALVQYQNITNKLYRDLGVNPSSKIRNLYRQIISTTKSVEMDLLVIKEDLQETNHTMGAYFCEYEIFKSLYQVLARGVQRTGQSVYVVLFTLTDSNNEVLQPKLLNRAMDILQSAIADSLRKGDVYSRFSNSQCVVMLPSINFENCEMVAKRIDSRFNALLRNKQVLLHKKMQPLDPIM